MKTIDKAELERERLLSTEDAATYLGLARATIYKMVMERSIPFTKVGSRVLFQRSRLLRFVEDRTVEPRPGAKRALA